MTTTPLAGDVARRLPHAMVRLRARLRAESAPADRHWTWSQITTLSRIAEVGPTTVSALSAAEHVRPQSMAETVAALRREGFVSSGPDPTDGRKTLISITAEGQNLISTIPALRGAWLEATIEQHTSPAERRTLAKAAEIMERLADS
jgi:DNA-binding MarR family transcriptional regulator